MTVSRRWTSADLEALPDDGKRYEIIDGELHVSKQPSYYHQRIGFKIGTCLEAWSLSTGAGEVNIAPGIIFDDDDDVAPDLIWISKARLATALGADGKLHAAPELVVEVLSPGQVNERRDREAKLKLYSRRGVQEYWILDWRRRQVEVYRRSNAQLQLSAALFEADLLSSPLLPGFSFAISDLFKDIPLQGAQ
ncbi:MAG: hypothetical protein DMF61_05690 [Blastocatellia bacterium AA13]|nr:MAG: hypothetical protein DMF61_05690 [Blastocatellia bacterium AA13]